MPTLAVPRTEVWQYRVYQCHVREFGIATYVSFFCSAKDGSVSCMGTWQGHVWWFRMPRSAKFAMQFFVRNFANIDFSSITYGIRTQFGSDTHGNLAMPRVAVWQYKIWECHVWNLAVPQTAVRLRQTCCHHQVGCATYGYWAVTRQVYSLAVPSLAESHRKLGRVTYGNLAGPHTFVWQSHVG